MLKGRARTQQAERDLFLRHGSFTVTLRFFSPHKTKMLQGCFFFHSFNFSHSLRHPMSIYGSFNERPGRGGFIMSRHFVWVFSRQRASNQYVALTAETQNAKVGVQMAADDNEKTPLPPPHPSPAGLQKTYRETSLKVLLQSPGSPPWPRHGIPVIN